MRKSASWSRICIRGIYLYIVSFSTIIYWLDWEKMIDPRSTSDWGWIKVWVRTLHHTGLLVSRSRYSSSECFSVTRKETNDILETIFLNPLHRRVCILQHRRMSFPKEMLQAESKCFKHPAHWTRNGMFLITVKKFAASGSIWPILSRLRS